MPAQTPNPYRDAALSGNRFSSHDTSRRVGTKNEEFRLSTGTPESYFALFKTTMRGADDPALPAPRSEKDSSCSDQHFPFAVGRIAQSARSVRSFGPDRTGPVDHFAGSALGRADRPAVCSYHLPCLLLHFLQNAS